MTTGCGLQSSSTARVLRPYSRTLFRIHVPGMNFARRRKGTWTTVVTCWDYSELTDYERGRRLTYCRIFMHNFALNTQRI